MAKTKEEVQTEVQADRPSILDGDANSKPVDLFEKYAVDIKAEKDGRWFYDFPVAGLDLFLARANNPRFNEVFQKKHNELTKKVESEDRVSTPEERAEIYLETMAEAVCLDWGGKHGMVFKGEKLPYTIANSLRIFTDPHMHDFANEVSNVVQDGENFRKRTIEREEKNSQRRSSGG